MRILYVVHQYFPHHIGGTEVYTRGLVRRARAAGHEPLVLTYRESPANEPGQQRIVHTEHEGVPLVELHHNLSLAPRIALWEHHNPQIAGQVEAVIEQHRPDLVHVMHAMKLSASVLDTCAALGIPTLVTLCDFWFLCPRATLLRHDGRLCDGPPGPTGCVACMADLHGIPRHPARTLPGPLGRWWLRRASRRRSRRGQDLRDLADRPAALRASLLEAGRIFALSGFARERFLANGYPEERIELLPHAIETDGLRPREGAASAPLRLVFIGNLLRHRGAHWLLEALRLIPRAQVRCSIHGPLDLSRPYVRELIQLAAVDDRVTLAGGFPPEMLGDVLDAADVLVQPALWYENNPLVVQAARHVGLPVIASRLGSLREMVAGPDDGWLVSPGAATELARLIDRLAADPQQVRRTPRPAPSMDQHAATVFEAYRQELCAR